MCAIFLDSYWVVHIPFVGMVKFKFHAHFPEDHLVLLLLLLLLLVWEFFMPALADVFSMKFE